MTTFRGWPCCTCVAEWAPVFESLANQNGVISGQVKILQLTGSNPASAGTHSEGGAFDFGYYSGDQAREIVALSRQMGADATWYRAWEGNHHVHGVLRGCPHNDPAAYQIGAVDDGYNGLGEDGRDGPDDGPRPLTYRTYVQGIDWAEGQLDMPLTDSDVAKIWAYTVGQNIEGQPKTVPVSYVMARVNPGPHGFASAVSKAVMEYALTCMDGTKTNTRDILRWTHKEASDAADFARDPVGTVLNSLASWWGSRHPRRDD